MKPFNFTLLNVLVLHSTRQIHTSELSQPTISPKETLLHIQYVGSLGSIGISISTALTLASFAGNTLSPFLRAGEGATIGSGICGEASPSGFPRPLPEIG